MTQIKPLYFIVLLFSIFACSKNEVTYNVKYSSNSSYCHYFSGKVLDKITHEPIEGARVMLDPGGSASFPGMSDEKGNYNASNCYIGLDGGPAYLGNVNVNVYVSTDSIWGMSSIEGYVNDGDTLFVDVFVSPESPIISDLEIQVNPTSPNTWMKNVDLNLSGKIYFEGNEVSIEKCFWQGEDRFGNRISYENNSTTWPWVSNVSGHHFIHVDAYFQVREGIVGKKTLSIDTSVYVTQMYPTVYGLNSDQHKLLRDKFAGQWEGSCESTWISNWKSEFSFDSTLHYTGEVTSGSGGSVFDRGDDDINFPERRFFIDSVDVHGQAFGWVNLMLLNNPNVFSEDIGDLYFTEDGDSLYFTLYRSEITYIEYALKRK